MFKKLLIGGALIIIALVLFLNIGGEKKVNMSEDEVYQNTISISRAYVALRLKTDKILTKASDYSDYNTWNNEMNKLIKSWKNLEEKVDNLEKQAKLLSKDKLSFQFVNEVHAFSKDEISNVFDKAPAGRKIRTLAKFLGVDAKRAFKILKNDQEFVKADAWNEAGDTFKKLETSATVLKDGCKVAGFVGAVVISGGAAGIAATGGSAAVTSAGGALVATVVGADLILEVSGDAATIALGERDKTTKYISKIRSDSYMEPAAAVLSLTSVPDAKKVELALMQAEALRSALQDKKILGIEIPDPAKGKTDKIKVSALDKNELKEWTKEQQAKNDIGKSIEDEIDNMDDWQEDVKILEDWLDDLEDSMDFDENEEDDKTDDTEDIYEEDDYVDGLEEWLDGFEDMDDWMDEFEKEEAEFEEGSGDSESHEDTVNNYMAEMQGRKMEEIKVLLEYGNKFEKLYSEGLINREEQDALMVEARRLNESKARQKRNIKE